MLSGLDADYLSWLESQVPVRPNRKRTYSRLLEQMYCKEFVYTIPYDDNRAEDGRDLRLRFRDATGTELDPDWASMGCSMLELVLGLAGHLSFELGGEVDRWFWQLIDNIGLANCTDDSNFRPAAVDDVLDRVIWRTYLPNGQGGLFPLKEANDDQRKMQLWDQMSAYAIERL